jgi:hypothetical protein
VNEPEEHEPYVPLPAIAVDPLKRPRPRFRIRLWMILLAIAYASLGFAIFGPRRDVPGPVAECHIKVHNFDNDPPSRVYYVAFLDGSREWYRTVWFGDQEILIHVECRDSGGKRTYAYEKPTPPTGLIDEPMRKVFDKVRRLAKARAGAPSALEPPIMSSSQTRTVFEKWPSRRTVAYLHQDPPHAESGPPPTPIATASATPTSTLTAAPTATAAGTSN